ncbi:hypothetical protein [Parendozoicomonas haliclonae]|nr:hypothetical protein [Parendozoicomonas haliclonae]
MKDSQRRSLVFTVLDDMKNAGEKITAQKLATQAKMGKQTVLPYYREWQELEILGESEEVELSQELIRVIKREIAKEKFRQGEQLREIQDQLDEERDHYAAQSEVWRQQLEELQENLQKQEAANTELSQQNQSLRETEAELRTKLSTLSDKNESLQKDTDKLEQKLEQEAKRAEQALAEQERRLDESHSKIVDHWLKVLDEERREKARAQKQAEKAESERQLLSKDKSRLEDQLEYEKRAHRTTTEQLGTAEQKASLMAELQAQHDKLIHGLGRPENPEQALQQLQEQVALFKENQQNLRLIEEELKRTQKQNAEQTEAMDSLSKENRTLLEQAIRLEARLEGIQLAKGITS